MKAAGILLAMAGLVLCASAPASAQSNDGLSRPLGSRITREAPAEPESKSRLSNEELALRTSFQYADCIVHRDEAILRQMIANWPQKFDEKQQKAVLQPSCLMDANLKMPNTVVRGALFRTFLLKDFSRASLPAFAPPIDYFLDIDRSSAAAVRSAYMLDFASCVLRADQSSVRAMVYGLPGDESYEAALKALVPKLGPCLGDGIELELNKSTLTSYFAEALYRESAAARTLTQAGAN